jgi:hypothetical protein
MVRQSSLLDGMTDEPHVVLEAKVSLGSSDGGLE